MRQFFSRFDIFVSPRTYWVIAALFGLFVLSYPYPKIFPFAKITLIAFGFLLLVDFLLLVVQSKPLEATRITPEKWSLGDENKVIIELRNRSFFAWFTRIMDELPVELQERKLSMSCVLGNRENRTMEYIMKPMRRGSLAFGKLRVFIATPLGLLSRRLSFGDTQKIAVYPSMVQMKKYSLFTVSRLAIYYGVKKMRRLGQSYEFEQIKDYVLGDDLRHLNWKATGKTQTLKTNHFMEERAQPVYCILDKSRNMNMAFEGMTLLDYAINTSLIISNTAIQKGDKAGLITFSDKVGTAVRADSGPTALRNIMENLYLQKYRQTEPDFEFLFNAIGRVISNRSLIFLFTNFESLTALNRVMPVLRKLNQNHLLVVILFQNAGIEKYAYEPSANLKEVYNRMIARQMLDDKRQMIAALHRHGVQAIASAPRDLNINVLNKYIELKAKGLI